MWVFFSKSISEKKIGTYRWCKKISDSYMRMQVKQRNLVSKKTEKKKINLNKWDNFEVYYCDLWHQIMTQV